MKAESGDGGANGDRFLVPGLVFAVAGHGQRGRSSLCDEGTWLGYGDLGSADA